MRATDWSTASVSAAYDGFAGAEPGAFARYFARRSERAWASLTGKWGANSLTKAKKGSSLLRSMKSMAASVCASVTCLSVPTRASSWASLTPWL